MRKLSRPSSLLFLTAHFYFFIKGCSYVHFSHFDSVIHPIMSVVARVESADGKTLDTFRATQTHFDKLRFSLPLPRRSERRVEQEVLKLGRNILCEISSTTELITWAEGMVILKYLRFSRLHADRDANCTCMFLLMSLFCQLTSCDTNVIVFTIS